MSSTLERLRRLHNLQPQTGKSIVERVATPTDPVAAPVLSGAPNAGHPADATQLEALVPGEIIENSNGACYVVTERYPLQAQRGALALAELLGQSPHTFATFHPTFGLHEALDFRQAIFLDTETTGLGNGAGVYCFMIGVGAFERLTPVNAGGAGKPTDPHPLSSAQPPTHFVVRQFFMRNPGEEGALLLAVAELIDHYAMSVTFNGRTFDLPLLRTRWRQNQHIYPELRGSGRLLQPERPHLDLLHPARRLWKRRLQSCRLINLETEILGLRRSADDVPGHLIPQLYTDYLHSGNACALGNIFYHNREDIVSMVALATHLSRAYQGQADPTGAQLQGLDWLSLGQCYEEQGECHAAEQAYQRALSDLRGAAAQAAIFQRLGQLQKGQARWEEATATWQQWITTVPGSDPTPFIELAKYCEWRGKDLEQAAMWTQWALHNLRTAPVQSQTTDQIAALEHRLARLQRKRTQSIDAQSVLDAEEA
ncbi:MAG: ribonuclease H-like domain-containing protein [Caldilineaceae bacterium]